MKSRLAFRSRPDYVIDAPPSASPSIRSLGEPCQIIEWPQGDPAPQSSGRPALITRPVRSLKAEIQAKRFQGTSVDASRYSANLETSAASPAELMEAIVAACRDLADFTDTMPADDQIIIEFRLIA